MTDRRYGIGPKPGDAIDTLDPSRVRSLASLISSLWSGEPDQETQTFSVLRAGEGRYLATDGDPGLLRRIEERLRRRAQRPTPPPNNAA